MPDSSFDRQSCNAADAGRARRPAALAAMVSLGFYAPVHAAAVVLCALAPWLFGASSTWVLVALAVLYLFPPLMARTVVALWGPTPRSATLGSGAFLRWWALSQLQLVFNRLPQLEELLRLIPGLYSVWLRLWGARVGRFVFWSPGVVITDRQLVWVGDRAVIGMGAKIGPHIVLRSADGTPRLLAAPVVIGAEAMVGGLTIFGPGARIAPGETSHRTLVLPPFWTWQGGRRRRPAAHDAPEAVASPDWSER
jgi:acetyltransferase-like isoleucine patch superfamily enzyme